MREPRDRAELTVRILCYVLAVVVGYEILGIIVRWNPFRGAAIPLLPALAATTNTPPPGGQGTNQHVSVAAATRGTNNPSHVVAVAVPLATNLSLPGTRLGTGVNAVVSTPVTVAGLTNAKSSFAAKTPPPQATTNRATVLATNNAETNVMVTAIITGTNAPGSSPTHPKPAPGPMAFMGGMPAMDFNPFGPPGMPGKGPDLPPAVQNRISRITASEILGPVIHPLPMALLGIAGNVAFLRADNGQTGLVKPGDSLDDIKLIRIGVNRVLIEEKGQKKELTIFSGYGGDSLLHTDSTNENNHL